SPISIRGNVYSPAWLVILSRRCPVATRVIVILAPATTEPEESVTTPRISVAVVWALPSNTIAARHNAKAKLIHGCCFFICLSLQYLRCTEQLYMICFGGSRSQGTVPPHAQVYKSYGLEPPVAAPRDPEKEKKLTALLDDAASRGWEIMLFGPGYTGVRRSFEQDPFGALSLAAGVRDTMRAF